MTKKEKADILKMDEIDTYFFIDECGAFMWRMNHDMFHGRIEQEAHAAIKKDVAKIGVLQKFAADNLTRFGIDPESVKDKKMVITGNGIISGMIGKKDYQIKIGMKLTD